MAVNKNTSPLQAMYGTIASMLDAHASGEAMMHTMCDDVDALLIKLWKEKAPHASQSIDLVAVGGYGRGELAPQSDWDIWFLVPDNMDEALGKEIESFLYVLWDLGAKIGHAVRSVEQTMQHVKEDWSSATAALEARLLCGKGKTFKAMQERLAVFFQRKKKAFVEAKLQEFTARHHRAGGTAFLMEPDIKESKGGLRDAQAVFWMAKAWYGTENHSSLIELGALSPTELTHLNTARDFLWKCRAGLHLAMKRATDRLGFEQQAMLADRLGYKTDKHHPAVELFMKDYFRHAGRIARVSGMLYRHFQEQLHPQYFSFEHNLEDGFTLEGQRVGIQHANIFKDNPIRLLNIFHLSQLDHRHLSSQASRQIRADVMLIDDDFRANPQAHQMFLTILRDRRNVAWTLREMNNTGVLGRFIPEFRDVVGLGQFNRYHAYTVDEHTLRAVAEARNFFHGIHATRLLLAHEVWHKISRPELLYLALIFHDIAKGMPGDHSENGEVLAYHFCQKLGLNQDAAELVGWLVREHLTMAVTSQRFDLSDPEVIRQFAEKVLDIERLNYLFLLTVADIAAVGPNVWNDWKGSLLSELYYGASHSLMQGGEQGVSQQERRNERVHTRIESTLSKEKDSCKEALRAILQALPWRCVMHFPPRQLLVLGHLFFKESDDAAIKLHVDEINNETLVMVLAKDQENVFTALTSVLATGHRNVLAAQAFFLDDGRILDVFHVQGADEKALSIEDDLQRLQQRLEDVLKKGFAQHMMPTVVPQSKITVLMRQVPVHAHELSLASSHQTAVEVTASDQPGLLTRLSWVISELGFTLKGANITTFGERVVDVFFVEDKHGECLSEHQVQTLCQKLKETACLPESDVSDAKGK